MDDEIDIEEHDVLDNPRIKSIFPDLSRVKIEIPDDDEQDQYEGLPMQEDGNEPQEMLYQYEYSFETTREDIDEEDESEYEENTYFYNNEIILGSKPPIDPDILYEEALNSSPVVYLENWSERLQASSCYCKSCEILFPTINALDAHKMISHSYLVAMETPQHNTARKSTVTSKFCNHCSKTFPDDTSLIKHLYELLPLNNYKVKDEPVDDESNFSINWPVKVKNTGKVITKLSMKKIKLEPEPEKDDMKSKVKVVLPRDGKFFARSSLVPKSSVFQCNVCQVGFISCFSALQHAKSCDKKLPYTKCGVCKRKIRVKDYKIHEQQHNYNDKLKIYTMNKSIYERVLCKCPKCLACFDELGFWAHYSKCKKTDKKCLCTECGVHISSARYDSHRQRHSIKKFTKKDFIIVEFYDQNVKAVNEKIVKMRPVRRKSDEVILYYCEVCGCCAYKLQNKGHIDGACKNIIKTYCTKCGLCFTPKSALSHKVLHEKKTFSLKDIQIYSITSGKEIEAPMPDMYKCQTCAKHFLYPRDIKSHDCNTEKYITCKICQNKYNIDAYKIHKMFHTVDKLIPELLKKYNSINNSWDLIYMCSACDLVTSTYDSAVIHAQGHLNFIISDFHKVCSVCELKIAEKDVQFHEKLHKNNGSLDRDSFKILEYNYKDLFKKEWMQLFSCLPKQHRYQILSKSIFRYTRSVKMDIEVSAPLEDIKYLCMHCNKFVPGPAIDEHMLSKCVKSNKFICTICNEICKTLKQFLSHEGIHEKLTKTHTIVTFNNECDKEFNNHLSLIESKTKNYQTKNSETKTKNSEPEIKIKNLKTKNVEPEAKTKKIKNKIPQNKNKKSYIIYKCVKCKCCMSLKRSTHRHNCSPESEKELCQICNQYYYKKKIRLHLEAHKNKPNITKNMFNIVLFNNTSKKSKSLAFKEKTKRLPPKEKTKKSPKKEGVAKIFKCDCGLHFTSMKSIQTHIDICNNSSEISKETCSKCQLIFPTDVLVTHLVNHHSKLTKICIEKVVKMNLIKCPECTLIFTTEELYKMHVENCDINNGKKCADCHLNFDKKCFPKHKCNDKNVTYVSKIITAKKSVNNYTVFKCKECDLSYMNMKSFQYHAYDSKHNNKIALVKCDICNLRFTNSLYVKHLIMHNESKQYKIKVVFPITGESVFITGDNVDSDTNKKSPRKRKSSIKIDYEHSALKKSKTNFNELDISLSDRKQIKKSVEKPSTSRQSHIDIKTEIPISNRASDIADNVSATDTDIDTSEIDNDKNESLTDQEKLITSKLKARLLVHKYNNNLFKCIHCHQHYMKEASFDYHIKFTHKLEFIPENHKCEICELDFSKHTLPRHIYIHHKKMGLSKNDFIILTETSLSTQKEIEKIKVKVLKSRSKKSDTVSEVDKTIDIDNSADICDKNDISDIVSEEICYYKCHYCNVCFINESMCLEHLEKHEVLDPKTYIQCKICDFQFLIDSLKEHMVSHHASDFKLESLTIKEYRISEHNSEPKIDTFQAIDKVQSRLVSTTTDVGIV